MKIDYDLTPAGLSSRLERFWALSGEKIRLIQNHYDRSQGSPVYTVEGVYTTRGWTEWTQGFEYGSEILQFDAVGDDRFLEAGRQHTVDGMALHVTHFGVHDHGFNNVSTFGNLLRLMNEGRIAENRWERNYYEMALKCSAAVQAHRWTATPNGGFIYSFNGPHSLFADTIRSLRALSLGHQLDHCLMGENDQRVSLLERAIVHAKSTADYSVYYGEGRDHYDVWGRTAHESIFNVTDGNYRCPNSQQGFSPFTTWTRGLAWIMVGFPEQLEFMATVEDAELVPLGGRAVVEQWMVKAARAVCDFYIENSAADGIPYWDTGAPNTHRLGDDYLDKPADPFNDAEPVDSSAAAIGAQGLLRLGNYLESRDPKLASRYWQAGLTVLDTLLDEPYLSMEDTHQGLILHSVYHRPNGWDYVPESRSVPCGESSMWGDYHARELALYVQRVSRQEEYLTFFLKSKSRNS